MCQISSRSVYSVVSGSNKTQIIFWTSAFCVVADCRQSDKVEYTGAQLQTKASKSDVQKRDEQTQKLNVFGRSGGG